MKVWIFVLLGLSMGLQAHEGRHAPLSHKDQAQLEKRIRAYEKRLVKNALDVHALEQLGSLFEERGRLSGAHQDFKQSAQYFERILAMHPEHRGAVLGQCRTALARHQFRLGLNYARKLATLAPDDIETWLLLGDAHFFLGHYGDAAAHFHRALAQQEEVRTLARIAQLFEARGDYPKATKFMEKALVEAKKSDPEQAAWVLTMLAELALQTNRLDQAYTRFQEALSLDPEMDYAYGRLAQIYAQRGEIQKARQLLHDLVHQRPRVAYFVSYAKVWDDLKRRDRAEYWYQKAESVIQAELAQGDFGHVRELVALWTHQKKNLKQALVLAKKEYDEIRQDAEGAEWLGWLYYLNGQPKQGLPLMRHALRQGMATPRFMLRAAIVSHEAGDFVLAAHLFRLANSKDTLIDETLVGQADELKSALAQSPHKIRDQFKIQTSSNQKTFK